VRLWNLATGEQFEPQYETPLGPVTIVLFATDSQTLTAVSSAAPGVEGRVTLWDMITRQQIDFWRQDADVILSMIPSPDGQTVVRGCLHGWVYVWDRNTKQDRQADMRHNTTGVWSLAISPDGQTLVTGSENRSVMVWRGTKD
jgi:WD40 repeat protein